MGFCWLLLIIPRECFTIKCPTAPDQRESWRTIKLYWAKTPARRRRRLPSRIGTPRRWHRCRRSLMPPTAVCAGRRLALRCAASDRTPWQAQDPHAGDCLPAHELASTTGADKCMKAVTRRHRRLGARRFSVSTTTTRPSRRRSIETRLASRSRSHRGRQPHGADRGRQQVCGAHHRASRHPVADRSVRG